MQTTMAQKQPFGTLADGRPVELYTLTDGGIACEILTYGATLRGLRVPDRDGRLRDVVLGFDRLEDYLTHDAYFGALIGRCANRIAGASVLIDGKRCALRANEGENHLHGGLRGFDKQLWTALDSSANSLTLVRMSPDGEEGYPGTLYTRVRFVLRDGTLSLRLLALTDRETVCSLTNHSYFNLDGHASGSVLTHRLQLHADRYTPVDAALIPDGRILPVAETAFDLRVPTTLGSRIGGPETALPAGLDHNFIPNGRGLREAAVLEGGSSGIRMTLRTDQPALQCYTANALDGSLRGKDGAVYGRHAAVCLEAQDFPDAPHHAEFPSVLLYPGRPYERRIDFCFTVVQP